MKHLVSTHELAGNYTVVIDDVQNKVYLDVLDCEHPGITMESHMRGSLMMDVSEMIKKYNLNMYPDTYALSDDVVGYTDAYESTESVKYRSRVIRTKDNNLRVFAPIILNEGDQIPDVFILYRKDLSLVIDKDMPEPEGAIVAVIDLHKDMISEYLQPKDFASAYIHGNSKYIVGTDIDTGQCVKANIYSDSLVKHEKDTETLIYQSFKDKRLIYSNIINISFVIKDDKIYEHDVNIDIDLSKTSAYLYWGRYANLSELNEPITIEANLASDIDDRGNGIFVYKPSTKSNIHNRIQYKGIVTEISDYLDRDVLLKHHTGGYESVCFDAEGNANVKGGSDKITDYVDVDRYTYSIDSYEDRLPSMSFEWPTAESSLSIYMQLNYEFERFVDATSRIDIKWVKEPSSADNTSNVIVLRSPLKDQVAKFCNILKTYFNIFYSTSEIENNTTQTPIITLTARNDNVISFKDLYFQKTTKFNLIGLYRCKDMTPDEKVLYKKKYRYYFTYTDTYAKISRDTAAGFLTNIKNRYIELSDIPNTSVHDSAHEVFADAYFYYVRAGISPDINETDHYKYGGFIEGNTLSLYLMKTTQLYNKTFIPVGDFIDIRTIPLGGIDAEGINSDEYPIDVKTRCVWCDYASVDKNGNYLIPSVASPDGILDIYSSSINTDSWSYGQILYNKNKPAVSDIYFANTHFKSTTFEEAYLHYLFDAEFDSSKYSWYYTHRIEMVRLVMHLMYYHDDVTDYTPLLVYDKQSSEISLYQKFINALSSKQYLLREEDLTKNPDGNVLDPSTDAEELLNLIVGQVFANMLSIRTASECFKDYLSTCSAEVLDDIAVSVSPVLYNDRYFCMLYGVPFTSGIKYADYKFKSIIIPCPRFQLKPVEDAKVYQKALTQFIRNNEAQQVIIVTYLDVPCIMPFGNDSDDFNNVTMFAYFDRNTIKSLGAKSDKAASDVLQCEAFDLKYVINASKISTLYNKFTYKNTSTTLFTINVVNYIEEPKDAAKVIYPADGMSAKDNPAVQAACAIVKDATMYIGVLGHSEIRGLSGNRVYPSKIVLYDKFNDENMQYPIWSIYTIASGEENIGSQVHERLNASNIKDRTFDMMTYNSEGGCLEADMVVFDDVYNADIRHISTLNADEYQAASVNIETIYPEKLSPDDSSFIETTGTILSFGSSYYYFNSLMSNAERYDINEYTSSTDTFIQTKSGELNSPITDVIQMQCYPSNNQLFTYSIVDDIVVKGSQSYLYMNYEDPLGKMYDQYMTLYDDNTDSVVHLRTLENIFDVRDFLRVCLDREGLYDKPMLNYRTQRFTSLVVYDERFVFDDDKDRHRYASVSNLKAYPSILSSKLYVTDGTWINYKKNRSSADVKLYPSVLYGSMIYADLKKFFDKIYTRNENDEANGFTIDVDMAISYVDKQLFHLYDFDLNTYSDSSTNDFNISSVISKSTSTILNYESKKNYEQTYKDIAKRQISFEYKMKLR